MKRIVIAARGKPEHLAELFRAELPEHEILLERPEDDSAVDYLVVGRPPAGYIAAVPGVKLILSLNAGIEHLLDGGEIATNIPIVRMVDDGLAEGMTEWVLAHALAWHRNILIYRNLQAEGKWQPQAERLAHERVVTVLGAGALGARAARNLAAIGFRTRVWSRSEKSIPGVSSFAGRDALAAAVADADILVNLLPLTAETKDIVDASLLAGLNRGAFFINGARGAHVVDADLIAALDDGRLSGAALDVFRTEPLPGSDPLWRHPRVLLSPHVAAPTHMAIAVQEIAKNIRRFETGEPIAHLVDKSLGY